MLLALPLLSLSCLAQVNYQASVTPRAIYGNTNPTANTSSYYYAATAITITNNTSSAKGFFIVTQISISNGGGTATIKSQITVNPHSSQTVTNQNGKSIAVGSSGSKQVNAQTKVTTDTNEDVEGADWSDFAPLAIEPIGPPPVPPDQSQN